MYKQEVNLSSSPPKTKAQLRVEVECNLDIIQERLNTALDGSATKNYKSHLKRLGRGGDLPRWYGDLAKKGELPNSDGKTIGSIIEMLLVAVLEEGPLKGHLDQPIQINPARGVDLPDLDLGVKSPSTNYCTSEPFFSPYERLLGNECDALILLTDYQEAKKNPPLKLKIEKTRYLRGSQIADRNLCAVVRNGREFMLERGEAEAARFFQFLAYVNQSDWYAKWLVKLLGTVANAEESHEIIAAAKKHFTETNKTRAKDKKAPLPDAYLEQIEEIEAVSPLWQGMLNATSNWLAINLGNAARLPAGDEFKRLKVSSLDGEITMSFALQWRYNFARVFDEPEQPEEEDNND